MNLILAAQLQELLDKVVYNNIGQAGCSFLSQASIGDPPIHQPRFADLEVGNSKLEAELTGGISNK